MNITRDNYEAWLIDYLEGNLDPGMHEEVRQFIADNPDIAEEIDGLDQIGARSDRSVEFPGKNAILSVTTGIPTLHADNLDLWLVARLEGDLNPEQLQELESWLAIHDEHAKDVRQVEFVKLKADQSTKMPSKASLKRTAVIPVINTTNLDHWLLARMEGETNDQENAAIDQYLAQNPAAISHVRQFEMTRLPLDETIHFVGKDKLRRFVIPVLNERTGNRIMALAAGVIIFLGTFLGIRNYDTPPSSIELASASWAMPVVPSSYDADKVGLSVHEEVIARTSIVQRRTRGVERVSRTRKADAIPASENVIMEPAFRHMIAIAAQEPEAEHATTAQVTETRTMTLKEYGALRLRRFTYGDIDTLSTDPSINRWELADAGLTGFNRLTGSNVRFDRTVDSEGKLQTYQFGTDRYHFARK